MDAGHGGALRIAEHHAFERMGKRLVFHVESMRLYEVTPLVLDLLRRLGAEGDACLAPLAERHGEAAVGSALAHLRRTSLLTDAEPRPRPRLRSRRGIRHLELMVTHGCNLRCRYCYGAAGPDGRADAPHLYGSRTAGMTFETAKRGIDLLFDTAPPRGDLSVVFFGGEPLLALPLIERIVPYIRRRERTSGRKVRLSLSTNGLLLTERTVRFLVANRISCQISIDGPPGIHDGNRRLPGGDGSYAKILPGVRRLLAARPGKVPARATFARGGIDLPRVAEHLLGLGFGSVHAEPAIGEPDATAVTRADLEPIRRQTEAMAEFLVARVREDRPFDYTNLVRYVRGTRVVRERLAHPCGAGRTYFALAQDGALYPCHRFVGMDEYRLGDVDTGLDPRLTERILGLTVDVRPGCRDCWARHLCGGGCWKHAVDRHGTLDRPDEEVACEITRHEIECAMAVNAALGVEDRALLARMHDENAEPQFRPAERRAHAADRRHLDA